MFEEILYISAACDYCKRVSFDFNINIYFETSMDTRIKMNEEDKLTNTEMYTYTNVNINNGAGEWIECKYRYMLDEYT